ncbi:hypothetical protein AB0C29_00215 [Actinoplanes sp. NPDC048791]|uniref:hypothetical protein n=1 Tax=Actinoplanes sp. NPDC048791 TaxID=3154623 RepID=UPI0033CA3886
MAAGPHESWAGKRDRNESLIAARTRITSPSGSGQPMSTQEVADAINAYLHHRHAMTTSVDHRFVSRYEAGAHRWPTRFYREAFRAVLQVAKDADLGFYPNRRGRPGTEPATEKAHVLPKVRSVNRLIASVNERAEMLSHLREQWHVLVRADNLFGPRHALAGVKTQLSVLQDMMSIDPDRQRLETVRLAAQYAESAAWLHEDAGDLDRAHYWTSQAMEWAYETDDRTMVAWTVYRRSQQLSAAGHSAGAIGLAQAARREEHLLPSPMRAAIRVQEALSFAMRGKEDTAQELLDQAHRWVTDDRRGDARAGHGSFCTAGYVELHRAACLAMRSPRKAIELYEFALPTVPAVYRRDRAAALASKAAAHADAGQPEEAACSAREALAIAQRVGSRRILQRLADVGVTLRRHRGLEPVAILLNELDEDT